MQFGEMIEAGAAKFGGNRSELARQLEQHAETVRAAAAGKRGLPDEACVKLAEILGEEWPVVVAARNEWTAKTEDQKKLWGRLSRRVSMAAATALGVTLFVTSSPDAVAAQGIQSVNSPGYTLFTLMRRFTAWLSRQTKRLARKNYRALRPRLGFAS